VGRRLWIAHADLPSKCIKHVPGKKTTVGDKPAVKRREGGLDLSRVSLVRGVTTVDDFKAQRTTVSGAVECEGGVIVTDRPSFWSWSMRMVRWMIEGVWWYESAWVNDTSEKGSRIRVEMVWRGSKTDMLY
jgi:hypothetical protein